MVLVVTNIQLFLCLFVTILALCFFAVVEEQEEVMEMCATSSLDPFISTLLSTLG